MNFVSVVMVGERLVIVMLGQMHYKNQVNQLNSVQIGQWGGGIQSLNLIILRETVSQTLH